jgi:hypothetical protein
MNEHQPTQKPELSNCIIRTHHSLPSFLARNPHTDMSLLNHRNVIRTIPDRERHHVQPILDHSHDESFL